MVPTKRFHIIQVSCIYASQSSCGSQKHKYRLQVVSPAVNWQAADPNHLHKVKVKNFRILSDTCAFDNRFFHQKQALGPGYYQCCGSGMFIPDPGSGFFPIPDPGSRIPDPGSQKSWGGKNFFLFYLFSFLPFCSFPPLLKQILTHNCCTFYHF